MASPPGLVPKNPQAALFYRDLLMYPKEGIAICHKQLSVNNLALLPLRDVHASASALAVFAEAYAAYAEALLALDAWLEMLKQGLDLLVKREPRSLQEKNQKVVILKLYLTSYREGKIDLEQHRLAKCYIELWVVSEIFGSLKQVWQEACAASPTFQAAHQSVFDAAITGLRNEVAAGMERCADKEQPGFTAKQSALLSPSEPVEAAVAKWCAAESRVWIGRGLVFYERFATTTRELSELSQLFSCEGRDCSVST